MGFELARPLALLLLLPCAGLVFFIHHKYRGSRKVRKQTIALALRLVLIFLLVLALSGPALLMPGYQAALWALVDASASMGDVVRDAEAALAQGFALADPKWHIGVMAFGGDAMVEMPLTEKRMPISLGSMPDTGGTDMGAALSMAMALLPGEAAGRIALISDGKDNGNSLDASLRGLAARGIPVDVLPMGREPTRDAQVTQVSPPAQVYQGEGFFVRVRVDATYETEATLILYANRQPVSTRDITLRKGMNTFAFSDVAMEAGIITYEAELVAEGDEGPRNNRLGAYMEVRGVPHILLVGEDTAELSAMLKAAGMETETLRSGQMPTSAEGLRPYHGVALVNVHHDDLAKGAEEALATYVGKLGHGLAAFGGDDSFALGDYRGTALEELLPVTMDADNRLHMPTLSLVFIIDKSGSMAEGRYGITRLDMAKEAAMRATEVLTAQDQVGVIAFDDAAKWVVPIQAVTDVAAIQEMIGTIRPGGGTAYYSSLAQAFDALYKAETQLKHIIFLTDGEAGDSGYEFVVDRMAEQGITLTTVAVGGGANAALLHRLAQRGGGRDYVTTEFDDIPKIFTKETTLATQAYIQNRTFYPVVWQDGPLTNYPGFPSLDGYLVTTAKPLATVVLATDREEPLLAWWQVGAGRVLSWMSDVNGGWSEGFLRWEQGAAFFAGMMSHVLPAEKGEGELSLTREGDTLHLTYTIAGEGEDGLTTLATVLLPDGNQEQIALLPLAPGVFEGSLVSDQEGAYALRVEQWQGEELLRTLESGLAVSYGEEYDLRAASGLPTLQRIAQETGGRVLEDPGELFTQQAESRRARRDMTDVLLVIGLILFFLDVAQRRLGWERWLPERRPKADKEKKAKEEKPQKHSRGQSKGKMAEQERRAAQETAEKLLAGRKKRLL